MRLLHLVELDIHICSVIPTHREQDLLTHAAQRLCVRLIQEVLLDFAQTLQSFVLGRGGIESVFVLVSLHRDDIRCFIVLLLLQFLLSVKRISYLLLGHDFRVLHI